MSATNQLKWNMEKENSLSLNDLKRDQSKSVIFRRILNEKKYLKFDGSRLKGELCYDSYYKEFFDEKGLRYTIYSYCYNIKDLKNLVENSELLEFSFEVQIESLKGIIGFEAIQWDFSSEEIIMNNVNYFEEKCEEIWKLFGSKCFPA